MPPYHDDQSRDALPYADDGGEGTSGRDEVFDFAFIKNPARIAIYDDLKSAPRVIEIEPAPTTAFVENLATKTYEAARAAGGAVPYTVVREVSENFIHARFAEVVVSVFNDGNTIRFSDQGPGITVKDKVLLPGFTSAIEPMKKYIRGVGSGLPIVKDYLDFSHGTISIEDNIKSGAVVTISLKQKPTVFESKPLPNQALVPRLSQREKDFLVFFSQEGALGVTDLSSLSGVPQSSTYMVLSHLEEHGLVEKTAGQKRILTDLGFMAVDSFLETRG